MPSRTNASKGFSAVLMAACLSVVSAPAFSALIEIDFVAGSGDGLLTRDTATGLEWLDLTETTGLSWNQIMSGAGGWVGLGFRHATGLEVGTLFDNAGITQTPPEWTVTGEAAQVSSLLDLIGITRVQAGREVSYGITATVAGPGAHFVSCLGVKNSDSTTSAVVECQSVADTATLIAVQHDFGHHLVRTAAVPVPTAVLLFGSGLVGMVTVMRRRSV